MYLYHINIKQPRHNTFTETSSQGSIQSASLIISKVSNNMASSVHSSSAGIWDVNQLILQVTGASDYNIIIGQWNLEYLSCWPRTVHRLLNSYININNKTFQKLDQKNMYTYR